MRVFDTGATRDGDAGKLDYEGFLSPLVLKRYAEYLNKHRVQADGKLRDSDNWQKGIPRAAYMKSLWRHLMDMWHHHRGLPCQADQEESACAVLFNAMGYLHEVLKEKARQPITDPARTLPAEAESLKSLTCGECRFLNPTDCYWNVDERRMRLASDLADMICFGPSVVSSPHSAPTETRLVRLPSEGPKSPTCGECDGYHDCLVASGKETAGSCFRPKGGA